MTDQPRRISRRRFLASTGSVAGIAPFVAPSLFARHPNDTLNVACIGVGGMGGADLRSVTSGKNVRIVALCDIDANRLGKAAKAHPQAKTFRDFRKLFDAMQGDIDAVTVSTPDHMHGPIAITAMRLGKHVYCQKPIAHNLYECRMMAKLAAEKNLATQMGIQIHSTKAYQTAAETMAAGVLGEIQEAHVWVSKSWAGPPKKRADRTDKIPANLDWDLWLGVAPERPYVKGAYHPAQWRRWLDFGSGTLGDMGCHIFDPVFTILGIGAPSSVISKGPKHFEETFAPDTDVLYEFPGTAKTAKTVTMRWTDGRRRSRPAKAKAQLPKGARLPGAGCFIVGQKGVMVLPHHGPMPSFYRDGEKIDVELAEVPKKSHYHEWTDACRGEGKTTTPFQYSGPLTEAVLLGTIAGHFPDEKLTWNINALEFTPKSAQANEFVRRAYRKGWEL